MMVVLGVVLILFITAIVSVSVFAAVVVLNCCNWGNGLSFCNEKSFQNKSHMVPVQAHIQSGDLNTSLSRYPCCTYCKMKLREQHLKFWSNYSYSFTSLSFIFTKENQTDICKND